MILYTESGSQHEFDFENNTYRRITKANGLRKDGTWVPYLSAPYGPPRLGASFTFLIDVRGDGIQTMRTTTAVTRIDGDWGGE